MLKLFLLGIALGSVHASTGNGVLLVENDDNAATTPATQQTTPAVIVESAKAKAIPQYYVPGIVDALRVAFPSLSAADQADIISNLNNQSCSVDSLVIKLGNLTEKLSPSQRDQIMSTLTQHEQTRRDAATALWNTKMDAETKELFQGLIENIADSKKSLVDQCTTAQNLAKTVKSESTLATLGVPSSLKTADCSNLAKALLPNN